MDRRLAIGLVCLVALIALVPLLGCQGDENEESPPEVSEMLERFVEACEDAGVGLEGLFHASGDDMPLPPSFQGYGMEEWAEMTAENHIVQLIRFIQFQDASSAERYLQDRRSGLIDKRDKEHLKQVARERGTKVHIQERPVSYEAVARVDRWCCDVLDRDGERGERILGLFKALDSDDQMTTDGTDQPQTSESASAAEGSASAPASPHLGEDLDSTPEEVVLSDEQKERAARFEELHADILVAFKTENLGKARKLCEEALSQCGDDPAFAEQAAWAEGALAWIDLTEDPPSRFTIAGTLGTGDKSTLIISDARDGTEFKVKSGALFDGYRLDSFDAKAKTARISAKGKSYAIASR